eukprot:379296_1
MASTMLHTDCQTMNCAELKKIQVALTSYRDDRLNIKFDIKQVLNAYHHIITEHEFEEVYNILCIKHDLKCEVNKCNILIRNNRSNVIIRKDNDNNKNISNNAHTFLNRNIIDSIHQHLIHSFDFGYRLTQKESNFIYNTGDIYMETDENTFFKNMRDIVFNKRQEMKVQGIDRLNYTKYNTTADTWLTIPISKKKDIKEQKHEDTYTSTENVFSFGYPYKYYYTNDNNQWYVGPKYKDLKSETLQNRIFSLDLEDYDQSVINAEILFETNVARNVIPNKKHEHMRFKIENIIVLILYCNFDNLSHQFSTTFRKVKSDETVHELIKRNQEYHHFSKILCNTVMAFGTTLIKSKVKKFYHGCSKLIFTKFCAEFYGPISTSTHIEVATLFARNNGIILELTKNNGLRCGGLTYFDCSWISKFGGENERLFIGGHKPLRFANIILIEDNLSCRQFIQSLYCFGKVLQGKRVYSKECSDDHYNTINNLIISKKNMFHPYIYELFTAFCRKTTEINVCVHYVPKVFQKLLLIKSRVVRYDFITKIFPN